MTLSKSFSDKEIEAARCPGIHGARLVVMANAA